jgi:hypothetical protein
MQLFTDPTVFTIVNTYHEEQLSRECPIDVIAMNLQ